MKKINEGFVCLGCGKYVSQAKATCRNHCPYCFLSLHVDNEIPGDRTSACRGYMIPIQYIVQARSIKICFQCIRCKKTHRNKNAEDDDRGSLDENIQKWREKYGVS